MRKLLLLLPLLLPIATHAETPGMKGVNALKHCIMQNDTKLCHAAMTPGSQEIFDKFASYELMPCLPTNFKYQSERKSGGRTIVKAEMPQDDNNNYYFRLVFVKQASQEKLDLPETLHAGLGNNWQDKLNTSEQIFLLMRQNMQGKLTCGVLQSLVKPGS